MNAVRVVEQDTVTGRDGAPLVIAIFHDLQFPSLSLVAKTAWIATGRESG